MVKTEIKCATGKSKGTIEDGAAGTVGKSAVTDTFETCKMIKPSNCKLSAGDEEAIETAPLKGELAMTGSRIEDKLESKNKRLCPDQHRRQRILMRYFPRWRRKKTFFRDWVAAV